MFYIDRDQFAIQEISEGDLIAEFSQKTTSPRGVEPKYFYEDGAIYQWLANGSRSLIKLVSEQEGRELLLKWAMDDASRGDTPVEFFHTKAELFASLEREVFCDDLWDDEDPHEQKIRAKLTALFYDAETTSITLRRPTFGLSANIHKKESGKISGPCISIPSQNHLTPEQARQMAAEILEICVEIEKENAAFVRNHNQED